jgi:phage terminase large subunit-like protein
MEPCQCFIGCSLFGWVKKSDGFRRFKRAYCCIPRKNAKSTFAAAVGNYCLILDGEIGAQVYSGATSKDQAGFVFKPARQMLLKSPKLCTRFGVEVNADSITILKDNSRFTRLIGNPGDGGSPSCAIVDEYHEHPDSRLYDTMTSGMGAREQPLTFVITTAGFNTGGPCFLLQRDMEKILDGITEDPTKFVIIYTIDLEAYTFNGVDYAADDWTTVEALQKANPNWGVSVNAEDAVIEQQEAIRASEKQNLFKTKKLNVWCSARNGYFNIQKWKECEDRSLKIDDFTGEACVKGLDLASQIDLAVDATLFQKPIDDVLHYYVFCKCYVPEETVKLPTNQHYQKWVHDGHLIATEGNEIALTQIKTGILADIANFDVRELDYDKHQATYLRQELVEETGVEGVEIPQNPPTLNIPMKWLQAMINAGRIHHDGNPVVTWCLSNVISVEDSNENDFPRKERPESKIDAVSAILCALYRIRAVLGEDTGAFDYTGF